MKKTIVIVVAIFLMLSLFGCRTEDNNSTKQSEPELVESEQTDNAQIGSCVVISFDWPNYVSAEDIINASSNIYLGTVTDISFEIVNDKTGEVDRAPDSAASRSIYTVYTVSNVKHFEGKQTETHFIRVTGVPKGYREGEQNELLVSAGLVKPGESLVYSGTRTDALEIGKEYLFSTVSFESVANAEYGINPTQFALDPASEEAKSIVDSFK